MKLSVMKLKQDLPPCLLQKAAHELDKKNNQTPSISSRRGCQGWRGRLKLPPLGSERGGTWLWALWCLSEQLQSSVQVAAEDRQRLQVLLRLGSAWCRLLQPLEAAPRCPALSSPARWPRHQETPAAGGGKGFLPSPQGQNSSLQPF